MELSPTSPSLLAKYANNKLKIKTDKRHCRELIHIGLERECEQKEEIAVLSKAPRDFIISFKNTFK